MARDETFGKVMEIIGRYAKNKDAIDGATEALDVFAVPGEPSALYDRMIPARALAILTRRGSPRRAKSLTMPSNARRFTVPA